MKKEVEINQVISDLEMLFKIGNGGNRSMRSGNKFYINKQQFERFEVINMLQEYFEDEAFKERKELEARRAKEKEDREAYKVLVDETVNGIFPVLQEVSDALAHKKKDVYDTFQKALVMKTELYDVSADQRSNTFTNKESTKRIILGQHTTDGYDDTVNEGISKVKQFISGLARDSSSQMLVDAVLKLLARDQAGNLKASRVMQLRKMATESGNEQFIDGVRIIEAAYRPEVSKFYVRAEYKNELGAWTNVPLGMTEA
jgi:hypothetical protein